MCSLCRALGGRFRESRLVAGPCCASPGVQGSAGRAGRARQLTAPRTEPDGTARQTSVPASGLRPGRGVPIEDALARPGRPRGHQRGRGRLGRTSGGPLRLPACPHAWKPCGRRPSSFCSRHVCGAFSRSSQLLDVCIIPASALVTCDHRSLVTVGGAPGPAVRGGELHPRTSCSDRRPPGHPPPRDTRR